MLVVWVSTLLRHISFLKLDLGGAHISRGRACDFQALSYLPLSIILIDMKCLDDLTVAHESFGPDIARIKCELIFNSLLVLWWDLEIHTLHQV